MSNEDFVYRLVIRYDKSAGVEKAKADVVSIGKESATAFTQTDKAMLGVKNQIGKMTQDYGMMKSAQMDLVKAEGNRLLNMKGMTDESRRTVQQMAQLKLDQIAKADFSKPSTGLKKMAEEATSTHRAMERLYRTGMAFVGMWVLVQAFRIPVQLLSTAMQFNSTLEDSKIGIASVLMASGEFVDSTGKGVQGWQKMNAAMELSGELIEQIKVKNLETYATLEQIVKAYQSVLSFGLRLEIRPEQMLDYTVAMVQAAGALRVNLDMMAEELRSMLLGTITPRNTMIATALGITPGDIAKYKNDAVGLMAFITERLKAFSYAGILGQNTWTGLVSNVKDAVANALGTGMMPLFNYLKEQLAGVQGYIVQIDQTTRLMKLNPELLLSIQKWSNTFIIIIEDIKRIGRFLDNVVVPPLSLINNLLLTIINSANAWANILPSVITKPETYEDYARQTDEFSRMWEIDIPEEDIKKGWESYQKYGSNAITALNKLVVDFNKSVFGGAKKPAREYRDPKDISGGLAFVPTPVTKISPEQAEVLMKITAETGHADETLKVYLADWEDIKKLGVGVLGLNNEQLEVAIKTAKEMTEAGKTGIWPKDVLERVYKDLVRIRIARAGITAEEAPLKLFAQIAQQTDQYEKQKEIIIETNDNAKKDLLLHKSLTPEIQNQINGMNELARLALLEVDRKKELKSISLTKDIINQGQEYAKITGNIEDQIQAMEDLEEIVIRELRIEQNRIVYGEEWLKLQEKILAIRKTGAEQRIQAKTDLPIEQYSRPLNQVQEQFAQATGDFGAYATAVRTELEWNIEKIETQTKAAGKYNDTVKERIKLMRELHDIDMKIREAEFKTYGSDMLQQAVSKYSEMTGQVNKQNEAEKILLENKIEVLQTDTKLKDVWVEIEKLWRDIEKILGKQRKVQQEVYGSDMLQQAVSQYSAMVGNIKEQNKAEQILLDNKIKTLMEDTKIDIKIREQIRDQWLFTEAVQAPLRLLENMQVALDFKSQLATLIGDWDKVKLIEIEALEVQRKMAITKSPAMEETINKISESKKAYAEAERTMNVPVLIKLGGVKASIDAAQQLANIYANILPNSVDIFTNAIRESEGSFKSLFKSVKEGFIDMTQDILLAIIKMEILKVLIGEKSVGKEAITGGLIGIVKGWLVGSKTTTLAQGGITSSLLAHYPIRSYQGGGIARSPQVGIFGEGGEEAFVPLKGGMIPVQISGGKGKGGVTHISYTVMNIEATDVDSFERKYKGSVNKMIYKSERQSGAISKLAR